MQARAMFGMTAGLTGLYTAARLTDHANVEGGEHGANARQHSRDFLVVAGLLGTVGAIMVTTSHVARTGALGRADDLATEVAGNVVRGVDNGRDGAVAFQDAERMRVNGVADSAPFQKIGLITTGAATGLAAGVGGANLLPPG
jgi:hypothetical protein